MSFGVNKKLLNTGNDNLEELIRDYVEGEFTDDENKKLKVDDISLPLDAAGGDVQQKITLVKNFIDLNVALESDFLKSDEDDFDLDDFDLDDDDDDDDEFSGLLSRFNKSINTVSFVDKMVSVVEESVPVEGEGELKPSRRNFILKGNAGQGKSTLTQFLWQALLAGYINNDNEFGDKHKNKVEEFLKRSGINGDTAKELEKIKRLPFRIVLSEFANYVNSEKCQKRTLQHYVAKIILKNQQGVSEDVISKFEGPLWEKLCKMPIIIMFDGLDEVRTARGEIIRIINSANDESSVKGRDIINVVTTRFEKSEELTARKGSGANDAEAQPEGGDGQRYTSYKLVDLNKQKVKSFVKRFFNPSGEEGAPESASERELMKKYENSEIKALMSTPLEVTLMCMIYSASREIPNNVIGLYDAYIKMYISREKFKDGESSILCDDKVEALIKELLYKVGFCSAVLRKERFSVKEIERYVEELNRDEYGDELYYISEEVKGKIPGVFLEKLGIMELEKGKSYQLVNHASVAEYLAANYVLGDDEAVLKLSLNADYANILKFVMGLYNARGGFHVKKKLVSMLDGGLKELVDGRIIGAVKLDGVIASRLLKYDLFEGLTGCAKYLVGKSCEALRTDFGCGKDTPYSAYDDVTERENFHVDVLSSVARAAGDIKKSGEFYDSYLACYERLFDMEASTIDAAFAKAYMQRLFNFCNSISSYERMYASYLLGAKRAFIDGILEKQSKAGGALFNGFAIKSAEQLAELHMVICYVQRFRYVQEFRYVQGFRTFFDRAVKRNLEYTERFVFELKREDTSKGILRFAITSACMNDDEDKKLACVYTEILDKLGLPALSHMFKTLISFNEESFKGFLVQLYSGVYDAELNCVFGKMMISDMDRDIGRHPLMRAIKGYLRGRRVDVAALPELFSVINGEKEITSLGEAIVFISRFETAVTCSTMKGVGFGRDYAKYIPLLSDTAKKVHALSAASTDEGFRFKCGQIMYLLSTTFEYQACITEIRNAPNEPDEEQSIKEVNEYIRLDKPARRELLKSFLLNEYGVDEDSPFYFINNMLYAAEDKEDYKAVQQLDFALYEKNTSEFIYRNFFDYERSNVRVWVRRSDYYRRIIEALAENVAGKSDSFKPYYLEYCLLILDESKQYLNGILAENSSLFNYAINTDSAYILKQLCAIAAFSKAKKEKEREKGVKAIASGIADAANRYGYLSSSQVFEIMLKYLINNYVSENDKDKAENDKVNRLIAGIYEYIPKDVEHIGVRKTYQLYLLQSTEYVFPPVE